MTEIINLKKRKRERDRKLNKEAETAANHAILRMQNLPKDMDPREWCRAVFGGIQEELAGK